MRKVLMIVNPRAGRMRIRTSLYGAIEKLCAANCEPTVVMTQYSGHATELAQRAEEYDLVICTGGDGTLNQVINGLLDSGSHVPLGYIPLGSTNDFAGSLGIPSNVDDALDLAINGQAYWVDVARLNSGYFLDTAMMGAFSRASYDTSQDMKNILGFFAYVLEGMKDLPAIRPYEMEIDIDGEKITGEYMLCAVCNSSTLGGLIPLDRTRISFSDGLFEMILAAKPQNAIELRNMVRALRQRDITCKGIVVRSGSSIKIDSTNKEPWTVDGERVNWDGHAEISVIKQAIELMLQKGETFLC